MTIPCDVLESDPAMDFVGPMLASDVAQAIAEGDMDPISMKRFPAGTVPVQRSSIQQRPLPQANRKSTLPPAKPKAAITSFFHASESAAAAVFNAPRSSPARVKRKLPPSFMDKWASKAAPSNDQSGQCNAAVNSAAASPLLTSHFFGGKPKKMSPPDEAAKKSISRSLESSLTYQSQDPCDVDVARNISFDPLNDKARILSTSASTNVSKENQAPNSQESSSCTAPPVKETAFSRMMRAGSMLQQHKLKKRKLFGAGFRSGKLRTTHQAPLSSRIEQFAFTANTKADDSNSSSAVSPVEQTPDAEGTSESISEPEDAPEQPETEFAPSKAITTVSEQNQDEVDSGVAQAHQAPATIATSLTPVPVASFDRFRFHHES
ncbi:unnamed protein product [Phytophthora lilii]|uniref:Unnamed protein product n=1 Tax=Phytophthora lilii TaxID=2077276 RepID=A0A9W7D9C0_9STRA|nr:unnamed protein product [Phytophthora lilii]